MRARAGMERSVFQERGDEDLGHWRSWACGTNWLVSEEKKVKGDPQFPRLGNAWQDVPATEAVSMGQGARFLWGMVHVTIPQRVERALGHRYAKLEHPSPQTLKISVKTFLLAPDCGGGPRCTFFGTHAKDRPAGTRRCQLLSQSLELHQD